MGLGEKLKNLPESVEYFNTELTTAYTTLKERGLGQLREEFTTGSGSTAGYRIYKWVRCAAGVVKGNVCHYSDNNASKIAIAASSLNSALIAGIALTTASTSNYTWIQVGGVNNHVLTDGGVAKSDQLIKDSTTAGMADTAVTTDSDVGGVLDSRYIFGVALDADSGSVCPAVLLKGLI